MLPQSVSEHSFHTAVLAMLLAEDYRAGQRMASMYAPLSPEFVLRVVERALLHDFEEVFVTDVHHDVKHNEPKLQEVLAEIANRKVHAFLAKVDLAEKYYSAQGPTLAYEALDHESKVIEDIVKFADLFEALLHIWEEINLGNEGYHRYYGNVVRLLKQYNFTQYSKLAQRMMEAFPDEYEREPIETASQAGAS